MCRRADRVRIIRFHVITEVYDPSLKVFYALTPAYLNLAKMMSVVKNVFNKLQMPEYEQIKTYEKGYEERRYAPSRWVSTSLELMTAEEPVVARKQSRDSFFKLFDYIQGENEGKNKIEMTAPVARQYIPGQGPACETKYTMSFFVPREFIESTPEPKAEDVFISDLPGMTVFVKKFGGFANDEKYLEEMRKFIPVLEADGHKVKDDVYYFAGYDSPFKLINRRNEIWLVKDTEDNQHSHLTVPAGVSEAIAAGAASPGECQQSGSEQVGEEMERSHLDVPAGAMGGADAAGAVGGVDVAGAVGGAEAATDAFKDLQEDPNEIGMD